MLHIAWNDDLYAWPYQSNPRILTGRCSFPQHLFHIQPFICELLNNHSTHNKMLHFLSVCCNARFIQFRLFLWWIMLTFQYENQLYINKTTNPRSFVAKKDLFLCFSLASGAVRSIGLLLSFRGFCAFVTKCRTKLLLPLLLAQLKLGELHA